MKRFKYDSISGYTVAELVIAVMIFICTIVIVYIIFISAKDVFDKQKNSTTIESTGSWITITKVYKNIIEKSLFDEIYNGISREDVGIKLGSPELTNKHSGIIDQHYIVRHNGKLEEWIISFKDNHVASVRKLKDIKQ